MATLRLVMVRHGESEWNLAGILQGHGDPALTAEGRAQAESVVKPMASDAGEIVGLFRSDLSRVAQTAAPTEAVLDVPVRVDPRLREIDVGWWSGLTWQQVGERDPEGLASYQGGGDFASAGGETYVQLRHRVWGALTELTADYESGTLAVFAHGGPIRVAVAGALGLPEGSERRVGSSDNGALSILERRDGAWVLVAYNRTEHLPESTLHAVETAP